MKRVLSVCLATVMCLALLPMTATAADTPSQWAEEQVNAAITARLVPQSLQAKYTQAITRAEFCALAVALYETVTGTVITERSKFNDTTDVNVEKMAALGVVNGVGNNNFSPNTGLTREQAATMLSRLANTTGKPLIKQAATFADGSSISSWAFEAVGQMQATGIMGGVGNNTFDPHGAYTREQSIITIMRLYDIVNPNGGNTSKAEVTGIAILSRHRDVSDAERKISIEPYKVTDSYIMPASASFDIMIYPVEIAKNYDYTLTLSNKSVGHIEKTTPLRKDAIDSIDFIADANGQTVITVSCEGFTDSFTVTVTGVTSSTTPTPTTPPTGEIEYYKECPSVPDFASVMGKDAFTLIKTENLRFDMIVYTYQWNRTRSFVMGEYYQVLETMGFKFSSFPNAGWTNNEFKVMGDVIGERVTITVMEDKPSIYDDSSLGG